MPRVLRALTVLAAASALGLVAAGPAAASATGYAPIAPFSYVDTNGAVKRVPPGCMLVHSVIGTGTDLLQQTATIDCAGLAGMRNGLFCNVVVDFDFRDEDGTYRNDRDVKSGCRTLGIRVKNSALTLEPVREGLACAELTVAKRVRATSCHTIG